MGNIRQFNGLDKSAKKERCSQMYFLTLFENMV